jgi:O-glycosyl hydrolase
MSKEFKLSEEQIKYIKEELKIDSLKNVKIIIENNSEYTRNMKEQVINDASNKYFVMKLCPPDYTVSLPVCPPN